MQNTYAFVAIFALAICLSSPCPRIGRWRRPIAALRAAGAAIDIRRYGEAAPVDADGDHYHYALEVDDVYGRIVEGYGGGFSGVSTHVYLVLGSRYTGCSGESGTRRLTYAQGS